MKTKVLVVDDDPDILAALEKRLGMLGHEAVSAEDGEQALRQIETEAPQLVLLDLEMPTLSGLEVLKRMRGSKSGPEENVPAFPSGYELVTPPVVVMTAYGSISKAVEAMKAGAYDFLTKPFDFEHFSIVIQRVLHRTALVKHVQHLQQEVNSRYNTAIGKSPRMREIFEIGKRAAQSRETMLLLGETGTGKDHLARLIHKWSPHHAGPFMAVNCSAFPETLLENELFGHERGAFTGATEMKEGKIEAADGGTVFLDEIGDMPPQLQGRLLRLLQDKEFHRVGGTKSIQVNVRFIAATNKDLIKSIEQGTFREDLYFRLNILSITMPPLRERMEDLPILADHFLTRQGPSLQGQPWRLSGTALDAMMHYRWPGNIRELENVIARATILTNGPELQPEHLRLEALDGLGKGQTSTTRERLPYRESMEMHSRYLVLEALKQTGGNQTRAAESLQMHRSYLARLLKRLGISNHPVSS